MSKFMQINFKINGESLLIGNDCPIKIVTTPEGIESSDFIVHTSSNATLDGSTVSGKKVEERVISVTFAIDDLRNTETIREELIKFFNPKHPIELEVTYGNRTRRITGEMLEFKFTSQSSMWDYLEARLSVKCPYPYFANMDNFGKNIASITPQFAFPLYIPPGGRIHSYRAFQQETTLLNDGDVPTGIEIRLIAERGQVTNPKITKVSTGEFIEVVREMNKGDVIIINTNQGNKAIYFNSENITNEKSKLSSFFSIDIGANVISYDAEENYTNLDVRLYYSPKYLGV